MIERPKDRSSKCGRAISDLQRLSWNKHLTTLQPHNSFIYLGGPWFLWNNGQYGRQAHRLARLNKFKIPHNSM